MSPVEDYFFSNNIQVWSHKVANSLTWFNTDMTVANILKMVLVIFTKNNTTNAKGWFSNGKL